MRDEQDDAFQQLMLDAAKVGMSEREIVSCFSEWLLINCWRFDGKDFRIFGNFRGPGDEVEAVEQDGLTSFQGKMSDVKRAQVRARIFSALESEAPAIVHYSMPVDDGPVRDFVSIARATPQPDGSQGLIGVSFECFKPLRQVAFAESSARDASA